MEKFLNDLPMTLRTQMSAEIHNSYFNKYKFFREIGNKQFLGWLGQRLKPRIMAH